eukprot:CAMPEP_0194594034 /NCGR_PEP_ID=MMETSP0292-20121207/23936_1 /TAXON_ID=39354 /ORGANISM="Heterosigma akashiwo, Strain CCMP2393" /LENGTH=38 /DNA_ID= /DNA_START= /DNA_END= /DNA_ORIENTATION=
MKVVLLCWPIRLPLPMPQLTSAALLVSLLGQLAATHFP